MHLFLSTMYDIRPLFIYQNVAGTTSFSMSPRLTPQPIAIKSYDRNKLINTSKGLRFSAPRLTPRGGLIFKKNFLRFSKATPGVSKYIKKKWGLTKKWLKWTIFKSGSIISRQLKVRSYQKNRRISSTSDRISKILFIKYLPFNAQQSTKDRFSGPSLVFEKSSKNMVALSLRDRVYLLSFKNHFHRLPTSILDLK